MKVSSFLEAREILQARMMSEPVRCSIAIASYNKPKLLERTLDSILRQRSFNYEVIVVDDGSPETETGRICRDKGVIYHRIEREPTYRNPSYARNVAYKLAKAPIIISQSDDVIHHGEVIAGLCELKEGEFHLSSVKNATYTESGILLRELKWYVHSEFNPRPLFFLGSVWRKDLQEAGYCPEFAEPGFDDDAQSLLLQKRGLRPVFRDDLLGLHQNHERPDLKGPYRRMEAAFEEWKAHCEVSGRWTAN